MSREKQIDDADDAAAERKVREVHARFYAAMSALDIHEMMEVWLCAPTAVCVHPGREALVGFARILESWQQIFASAASMSVSAGEELIVIAADAAWVSCVETISITFGEEAISAAARATNIFRRTPEGRWRLIVHHASPIPARAAEEWPDVIN